VVVYATIFIGGLVKTMGRDHTPTLTHYLTAFAIEPGASGLRFTGSAWDSLWTTLTISAAAAPGSASGFNITAAPTSRREPTWLGETYRRRFPLASTMLGCPGGFGAGYADTAGAGAESIFANSSFSRRTRGESGKRSASITSRSTRARSARSWSVTG
jgi:hypothetical protein